MKKYVIVPFGLYDKVVDLNNEKNKLSDDGRMKCVIVKDSKHCLTGHRAYSSRLGTGLDYPYDAKVNNYSAISRIPVPLLWNLINRQRNNDRTEYKVKIKDLQGNEYTLNEYADELIVKHICGMIEDFENEQYSGGVERQILIPISNELTEYAQEYLIRAASAKGLKLTFVWKEIAALMQYLKENPLKCKLKKGSKVKVVYIGIESIESAFFELTEGDSGCLVPIRRRPVINRAQSTGLELLFIQLHDYFKDKCGYDENTASKLIWQVVNLRRDVFYRITGRDYENEPGILYTKNLIRVDQIDFENDFTGTILGDSPLYRTISGLDSDTNVITLEKFVFNDACDYDAVLLCGDFVSGTIESKLNSYAKTINVNLLTSSSDLITEGCILYKYNLENDLPTYKDVIPSLSIAYCSENFGQMEYMWEELVPKDKFICGGGEYTRLEPCTCLGLRAGQKELCVYLRVDEDQIIEDEEKGIEIKDNGIRKQVKTFDKATPDDIRLIIKVSMKPAAGLAKIIITDDRGYLPSKGVVFDYSSMVKAELPKLELAYPQECELECLKRENENISYAYEKILNFAFYDGSSSTYDDFTEIVINAYDVLGKAIGKRFMYYDRSYNPDLYAGENQANQERVDAIMEESEYLIGLYNGALCIRTRSGNYTVSDNNREKKLVTKLSYLYKGAPSALKQFLADDIDRTLSSNSPDMEPLRFYACCRVFYENREKISKLFKIFNALPRQKRANDKYYNALFWLLTYTKEAKFCLTEETATNLLYSCYDGLVEQQNRGVYNKKFLFAVRIFLVSLKYRCIDGNFMYPGKESYEISQLRKKIFDLIDRGIVALQNISYRSELLSELKGNIVDFVKKKGNMDFIIKLNQED